MTIEICKNHTGKMENIQSISTSVLLNPFCQKNRKVQHCLDGGHDSLDVHRPVQAPERSYDCSGLYR